MYDQLERTGVAIVGWWIVLVGRGDMSWGPHGALCQEFFFIPFFLWVIKISPHPTIKVLFE